MQFFDLSLFGELVAEFGQGFQFATRFILAPGIDQHARQIEAQWRGLRGYLERLAQQGNRSGGITLVSHQHGQGVHKCRLVGCQLVGLFRVFHGLRGLRLTGYPGKIVQRQSILRL